MPATTITIYHNGHTTTSATVPGSVSLGYKSTPQEKVYEWDFYVKYQDDPGYGFHVYGARCGTLPSKQGFGCYERALKTERGYLPKATWVKYKCGTTW